MNQCHDWGQCDMSTGKCSDFKKPDGAACNDGSSFTKGDACVAGSCQGSMSCGATTCKTPVQPCLEVLCIKGQCKVNPREECSTCSDSRADTAADMCRGGSCIGSYAGVPRIPIAGSLYLEPGTKTLFTRSELANEVSIEIKVRSDTFSPLDTDLSCGYEGSNTALILLPAGTPPQLVESCYGRVVSGNVLRVAFRSTEGLASGSNYIKIAVAPGVLESGGVCSSEIHLEVEEDHHLLSAAISDTIGMASPGATLMQVKLSLCAPIDPNSTVEEELDPFLNPPGLLLGAGTKRPVYGGLVLHGIVLAVFAALVALAYLVITMFASADVSPWRRLEAARIGWLPFPYLVFYPGGVLLSCRVLFYGDDPAFQVFAVVLLILFIATPVLTFLEMRKLEQYAEFSKEDGWGPKDNWVRYRLTHILFDCYYWRTRHWLVADLTNVIILSAVQSIQPVTQAGCERRDWVTFGVMVVYALAYTIGKVTTEVWEYGLDVIILWGEIAAKILTMYNKLELVGIITFVALGGLVLKTLLGLWYFFVDEMDHWMKFYHGGQTTRPGFHRYFKFFLYFAIYDNVPRMLRQDELMEELTEEDLKKGKSIIRDRTGSGDLSAGTPSPRWADEGGGEVRLLEPSIVVHDASLNEDVDAEQKATPTPKYTPIIIPDNMPEETSWIGLGRGFGMLGPKLSNSDSDKTPSPDQTVLLDQLLGKPEDSPDSDDLQELNTTQPRSPLAESGDTTQPRTQSGNDLSGIVKRSPRVRNSSAMSSPSREQTPAQGVSRPAARRTRLSRVGKDGLAISLPADVRSPPSRTARKFTNTSRTPRFGPVPITDLSASMPARQNTTSPRGSSRLGRPRSTFGDPRRGSQSHHQMPSPTTSLPDTPPPRGRRKTPPKNPRPAKSMTSLEVAEEGVL